MCLFTHFESRRKKKKQSIIERETTELEKRQDRNIYLFFKVHCCENEWRLVNITTDNTTDTLDGTTVESKGKLIITEIFPSVQKHDI